MRIALPILATSLALVACGTKVYDVQQYGPGQFVIFSKSRNQAAARSESLEAANNYCAQRSGSMKPIAADKVTRAQFELVFTCQ